MSPAAATTGSLDPTGGGGGGGVGGVGGLGWTCCTASPRRRRWRRTRRTIARLPLAVRGMGTRAATAPLRVVTAAIWRAWAPLPVRVRSSLREAGSPCPTTLTVAPGAGSAGDQRSRSPVLDAISLVVRLPPRPTLKMLTTRLEPLLVTIFVSP